MHSMYIHYTTNFLQEKSDEAILCVTWLLSAWLYRSPQTFNFVNSNFNSLQAIKAMKINYIDLFGIRMPIYVQRTIFIKSTCFAANISTNPRTFPFYFEFKKFNEYQNYSLAKSDKVYMGCCNARSKLKIKSCLNFLQQKLTEQKSLQFAVGFLNHQFLSNHFL